MMTMMIQIYLHHLTVATHFCCCCNCCCWWQASDSSDQQSSRPVIPIHCRVHSRYDTTDARTVLWSAYGSERTKAYTDRVDCRVLPVGYAQSPATMFRQPPTTLTLSTIHITPSRDRFLNYLSMITHNSYLICVCVKITDCCSSVSN